MEAAECGAACLTMVLAFHGCHVPLAEMRVACEVSREGSRAPDLLRAGRAYGMIARGWKANVASLAGISLPAVVFWNKNHFVVLEGRSADREWFRINDPAFGHRRIPAEEFVRSFSGIALTFSPGLAFRPRPKPRGIFYWSLRRMGKESQAAAFVFLAAILLAAPSLAVAVLMRVFVDEYYIQAETHWLWPLLGGMAAAAALQLALAMAIRRVLLRWEICQAARDGRNLLDRLRRLSMSDRLAREPAELAARLELPAENARLLFRNVGGWLIYLPTALASILWMCFCGWKLAAWLGLLFLAIAGVLWLVQQTQDEQQAEAAMRRTQFENTVVRELSLLDHLKAGDPHGFLRPLAEGRRRLFASELRLAARQWNGRMLSRFLAAFALAGILTVGTLEIMEGRLTPGLLIAFLVLWLPLSGWVMQTLSIHHCLRQLAINRERMADLPLIEAMAGPSKTAELSKPPKPFQSTVFEQLEARDVTFGYSRTAPAILKNISIRIVPGRRIALIGESGAGKTTLVRLLAGLLKPASGDVLINGEETGPETFSRCAAWADSSPAILAGSVMEHLRLGNESLSSEDVRAALRMAGVSDALAKRVLSRDGASLSPSERQRLEMARLFARTPGLLLLDEAMNALDAETARLLAEEWQRQNRAWLWVTQSAEIARLSDEIWVLEGGNIVAHGAWETLAKQSGSFRRLMGT